MHPFFDVDVDVGLLVEPVIVRLPVLARIHEAEAKVPNNVRD